MGMQPGHMRHMAVEADEVSQVIGICKGFKVSHNLQDRAQLSPPSKHALGISYSMSILHCDLFQQSQLTFW